MEKYTIDGDARRLLYGWLFFAISSLILAGIFAFLVVMARTPGIQDLFPRIDYVRVALVGHVILSFVIWFLAFEGLLWILTSTVLLNICQFSKRAGWGGYILSVSGTVLIVFAALFGLGDPSFVNYIPVLTHPIFYAGLLILTAGITITVLNTFLTLWKARKGDMPLLTFGMMIAGVAFISAITCFGISSYVQLLVQPEGRVVNIETLFWGGAHVLQFANTIAMVTAWLFLFQLSFKEFPIRDSYSRLLYTFYLIFIIPAPFIYPFYGWNSYETMRTFTALMEYGLGPSTAVFSIAILTAIVSRRIKGLPWDKPEFSSLLLSMGLFALGGLISFTIYGYNTKIPSHYHGVIGGVTLSFMGLTHYILSILKREVYSKRISILYPYIYGLGQSLFVIGMFWAGSHGVARKTFGAAQHLDNIAKVMGMALVGVGGIIAIIGGVLFITNSVMSLIQMSIKRYLPLFKFKICILITLSAIVGFILTASERISIRSAIFLILAMMLASGSVSAFNHYFDRDIDAVMERTKGRPIPSGSIEGSRKVLWIAVLLFIMAILLSSKLLNYMVALHLFLGAFVYGVVYTAWLKRRSWANIIIGGLSGSFAVLAGGASARPEFCLPPLLLALVLFFWTPSHFWSFAIAYREEYRKAGIPMLPVVAGCSKTALYILLNTVFLVISSILPYLFGHLGVFYAIMATMAGLYFIIENIRLLSDTSRETAWKNFKASIHYLWILFLAIVVDVVLKRIWS